MFAFTGFRGWAVTSVLALFAWAHPSTAAERQPWEGPSAGWEAGEIRAALAKLPPRRPNAADGRPDDPKDDVGADFLLSDRQVRVRADGGHFDRERTIFLVTGKLEGTQLTAATYPWHSAPSVLRGRLMAPDGSLHVLETVASATRQTLSWADAKKGSLVEIEKEETSAPLKIGPGYSGRGNFIEGAGSPRVSRFTVELPATLPFDHFEKGAGLSATVAVDGAVRRYTVTSGQLADAHTGPWYSPGRLEPSRVAFYTTWPSWAAIAGTLSTTVEGLIAKGPVGDTALEWKGAATEPRAIVQSMLTHMQADLALGYGDYGLWPVSINSPQDVVRRSSGTDFEASVLLVALLRSVGMAADVALVHGAEGADVPIPRLLSNVLVRVSGTPPLWVSVRDRSGVVSPVRLQDADMPVMIISPKTTALERTPVVRPEDNQLTVRREVRLSAAGGGSAFEETQDATGEFARDSYDKVRTTKSVDQSLGRVASDLAGYSGLLTTALFSSTLSSATMEPTTPSDSVRFTGRGFESYFRGTDEAPVVELSLATAMRAAPTILRLPPTEGSPLESVELKPRLVDETVTIVPARDMVLESLPELKPRDLSPMKFEQRLERRPSGEIVLHSRLEVPARRLEGADAARLQRNVSEAREDGFKLRFTRPPLVLARQWRIPEAVAELRLRAAEEPNEPGWPTLESRVWRNAGANNAAIAAARRAVAIGPRNGEAWKALGLALSCDSFGRAMKKGMNRQAALAAFAEAVAAVESPTRAWGLDTSLLFMNDDGEDLGPGIDFKESLSAYERLQKPGERRDVDSTYLALLLDNGEYEKAVAYEQDHKILTGRMKAYLLIAYLMTTDATLAVQKLNTLAPTEKDAAEVVTQAVEWLENHRVFRATVTLLKAVPTSAENETALALAEDVLKGMPIDKPAKTDPVATATAVLRGIWLRPLQPELFRPYATPTFYEFAKDLHAPTTKSTDTRRPPAMMISRLRPFAQGVVTKTDPETAAGLPLRISFGDEKGVSQRAMMVKESGVYRVAALGETRDVVGAEMLKALDAKKVDKARAWFGWISESKELPKWLVREHQDSSTLTPDDLRAAAIYLLSDGKQAVKAFLPAKALLEHGHLTDQRREDFAVAVSDALVRIKEFPKGAELIRLVTPASEKKLSVPIFTRNVFFLDSFRKYDDAVRFVQVHLADEPKDPAVGDVLYRLTVHRGDNEGATEEGRRFIDSLPEDASVGRLGNNVAWGELASDHIGEATYRLAQRAAKAVSGTSTTHTLALAAAETGHVDDAYSQIEKLLTTADKQGSWPDYDWLPIGRLYQSYGLSTDAIEAYRKAEVGADADPLSAAAMARHRREALERQVAPVEVAPQN